MVSPVIARRGRISLPKQTRAGMIFQLAIENEFGCVDTIHDSIFVKYESTFWVPKAFSPDGDDLNDIFIPKGTGNQLDFRDYQMVIYDRWGGEVFRTRDVNEGWNGGQDNSSDLVAAGAYVYYIRYQQFNGIVKHLRGTVTVYR